MFIVNTKLGEEIVVPGRDLVITVTEIRKGVVSLGFSSPSGTRVYKRGRELLPSSGGCWYCHEALGIDEAVFFSTEFDAYVHESCLRAARREDLNDPEARIMAKELLDATNSDEADPRCPDPDYQVQ